MNIIQQIKQTVNRLSSLIKDSDQVIIDCYEFEITKREIITSVAIFCFLLIIGFSISEVITNHVEDKKRMYNQAMQIDTAELFEYGMATKVGNAFCYGTLEAVDTVGFEDIEGDYLYIRRELEEYTRHEREVSHKDSDGNTYYTTEEYWTWDVVSADSKHSEKITFLDVEFDYSKIQRPYADYIDTKYISGDVRYVYYGVDPEHTGTIFTELKDDTISDGTPFWENSSIQEVLEAKNQDYSIAIFWIVWVIFMAVAICGFYYLDNTWLE